MVQGAAYIGMKNVFQSIFTESKRINKNENIILTDDFEQEMDQQEKALSRL